MEDKKIRDKFVSEKLFYYMKLEKLYLGLGIIFSTIRTFGNARPIYHWLYPR